MVLCSAASVTSSVCVSVASAYVRALNKKFCAQRDRAMHLLIQIFSTGAQIYETTHLNRHATDE